MVCARSRARILDRDGLDRLIDYVACADEFSKPGEPLETPPEPTLSANAVDDAGMSSTAAL